MPDINDQQHAKREVSKVTKKPLVGVTGPDKGGFTAWMMTRLAIIRAGGKAIRITPARTIDAKQLDALVIGGGTDVEPVHYGQEPHPQDNMKTFKLRDWLVSALLNIVRLITRQKRIKGYDTKRDVMEKNLIEYALEHQLPVLGICRGAQLLNIVTGGSLYQKITEFYSEEPHVRSLLPRKKIVLEQNSKLAAFIQDGTRFVNALHDQAIHELGAGMVVTARDMAGVVQAIEHQQLAFVIGVQWHPEYLPQIDSQQRIFAALVQCGEQHRKHQTGQSNA